MSKRRSKKINTNQLLYTIIIFLITITIAYALENTGKVDSVNGIEPDAQKNVQVDVEITKQGWDALPSSKYTERIRGFPRRSERCLPQEGEAQTEVRKRIETIHCPERSRNPDGCGPSRTAAGPACRFVRRLRSVLRPGRQRAVRAAGRSA